MRSRARRDRPRRIALNVSVAHNDRVMPVTVPAAVIAHARETTQALASLAGIDIDAEEVLGGRAVLLGLRNRGRISAASRTI